MKKAAHTKTGNMMCKVVTSPTPANRKMNMPVNVSKTPTPANRKMNAPARVQPKKY